MGSARCPIVLRIFKARRPLTSSVRCIDGVCGSGRVFSKHSASGSYIIVLGQNGPFLSFPYKNCHNHNDLNIHYNRVLEIYQKMEHPTQQGFIELAAPPTTVVLNGGSCGG